MIDVAIDTYKFITKFKSVIWSGFLTSVWSKFLYKEEVKLDKSCSHQVKQA